MQKKIVSGYFEFRGFLSFLILHELSMKKSTGEELAVKIGKRKGAMLTPGTIYPALKKLRKSKLVVFHQSGRKKSYELTVEGKRELRKLYILFSRHFFGLKKFIARKNQ